MKTFLVILIGILMLATLGVLFAGLLGLVRGGGDPRRSNKLMQWRVILQGAALLLFALLMTLLRSRPGGLTGYRSVHMVRRLYCRCEQAVNPAMKPHISPGTG